MKHYLCKYNFNWADEADFEGIELIDEETHNRRREIQKLISEYNIDPEITLYFGTNEDDYFNLSEVIDPGEVIAEESYDDIKNLICDGYDCFGFVPYLGDIIDILFDQVEVDLEYDINSNPDKLNEDELNEIEFYQKLYRLTDGI
jgi:hypothetical protein